MLEKAELAKAGEFLWGAIAESIKALSLKYTGEPAKSHYEIRRALKDISLGYHNKGFDKDWPYVANLLHVNFYETFMEEEYFRANYEQGKMLLDFITKLNYKPLKKK